MMQLQLLGPVEVTSDGRPLPLGATKQRALLAMLALEANTTVPVDSLVDGLWGDDPPATAAKMVQLYVSQLRRALSGSDACIVTHGRGYELRLPTEAIDAACFQRLVAQAALTDGGEPPADGAARAALDLWHGAALADVAAEPFAAAEIRRLDELRLTATELAVDADLAAGRNEEALAALDRLIAAHPLREHLHERRMLALYRAGRQAEALDAYVEARERLVDAVGVEPGADLRELHDCILRQDPALRLTPRGRAAAITVAGLPPPTPPRPPPLSSPPAPRRLPPPRRLVLLAGALLLLGAAVFAATRLAGDAPAPRLEEGAVGMIDADHAQISTDQYRGVGLGAEPQSIVGGAGSVWIASPAAGTVSRLSPGDHGVVTIGVGGAPGALAFGAGSLWVADEDDGTVAQVDPATNRVAPRVRVGNGLRALAVGHGKLWAAAALDGEVVGVDLRSGRRVPVPAGGHPAALAVSRDAVWAATEENGQVLRIDPRTGVVVDAIDVGHGPSALAVGHGAVWAANRQDGTVSRIDPSSDRVTSTVSAGRAPAALAMTDGGLWVADADGAVLRLDPRAGAPGDEIPTGSSPAGLATLDGAVWVAGAAPPAAHRGGTLRVGRLPIDLDPAKGGYDPSATGVLDLAYDGLVRYRRAAGAAGARLVPGLAVGVPAPSNGGRTYVFRLRPGGRYSDGTPVRAGDVRASMERMLLIQGHDLGTMYDGILGAPRCRARPPVCDLSRGIVTDEAGPTVRFRLRRPDPEFLQKLTLPLAVVLPGATPRRATDRPIAGTGPYRIADVVRHRRAVLTRNPRFRPAQAGGRTAGFADRIELRMAEEPANLKAFQHGRLDMTALFIATPRRVAALRTMYGTRLRSGAFAKTIYAWLNVHEAPFDDVRVRRAVNFAVDRTRMAAALGGPDTGSPACQLLPPGFAGYRPTCPFTAGPAPAGTWIAPDVARARALVAASGRRGTRVAVWTSRPWAASGHVLAAALDRIGLQARVVLFTDLGQIMDAAHHPSRRPQIGINGWIADYPEPAGFLRALVGCSANSGSAPGGTNLSQFCDHGIDAAIERDQAEGASAGGDWQHIEERIAARAPVVPLLNGRFPILTARGTGNVQFHPLSGPLLDAVWVR
jgi:YVTN family beta-propeller protein